MKVYYYPLNNPFFSKRLKKITNLFKDIDIRNLIKRKDQQSPERRRLS